MLNRLFQLETQGTTVRREAVAGVTTFLTMSYIIAVNPSILADAGMDRGALITVTVLASMFGTLLAGLWANVPFAMAPGMGLNAFFTYGLVMGQGVDWQTALGVVFLSGVFFLLLTVVGIRQKLIHGIPLSLRLAVPAGIGLFITFIGLRNLGLVDASPATLVQLGAFTTAGLLGLAGLVLTAVLELRKIPGGLLIGIVAVTVAGVMCGLVEPPRAIFALPPSPAPVALKLNILGAFHWSLAGAVFSFMFVDLFDSVGTVVACSYEAGLVKENGEIDKIDRILEADAVSTLAGAVLGTSTTTTYIESGTGIAAGGRTGLASVVTATCFLAALICTPLIAIVPAFATAPALILVGVYMFRNIRQIDFRDLGEGLPAFLTILMMPLTYSISTGLAFGFLSHVLIGVSRGRARSVHPLMWVIAAFAALSLVAGQG